MDFCVEFCLRLSRKIEYIEAIVREWVNGQLNGQLLESKLSIVRECWLGWDDAAHALHVRTREHARRWRAENRRTGAVNAYMTMTSTRYCNHTPPLTTPGPGEATMGRDCLVEAGKGSRNASPSAPERDSCRPAGSDSRALPRAKIAFNSDQ